MPKTDLRTVALVAMAAWVAVVGVALLALVDRTPATVAAAVTTDEPPESLVQSTAPIEVVIEQGSSGEQIAALLVQRGVLAETSRLSTLLTLTGAGAGLHAGRYELPANTPATEVLRRLHLGLTAPVLVAVPEGLRLEEVRAIFVDQGFFTPDEWDAALETAQQTAFVDERPEGASLLGFLLPASYPVGPEMTANEIVQAMLDHFDREVTSEIREAAADRGFTLYELLTLASIVEREAFVAEDQPLIASVFLNRLELGMALQADPTVQFAVAPPGSEPGADGWWKRGLTIEDLELDSPYNTHVYPGLPPGPIANPGIDAIRAVTEAPASEYFYFVAAPECDGTHRFAETLDEHNVNVEAFLAAECGQ